MGPCYIISVLIMPPSSSSTWSVISRFLSSSSLLSFAFTEWNDAFKRLSLSLQQEAQSMLLESRLLQHARRNSGGRFGIAENGFRFAGNLTWWRCRWFFNGTFTIDFKSFSTRSFWWLRQVRRPDGWQFRLNWQMGQGAGGQQTSQCHLLIVNQFGHCRLVAVQYWIDYTPFCL